MALLGIKDRYLKRLRDNGLLGYTRNGDKYWYTQSDIDRFLARSHNEDFANREKRCRKVSFNLLIYWNVKFYD